MHLLPRCVRCHACTHACTHAPPVHRHHSMTPSWIPAKRARSLYATTLHPAGAPVCTLGPVCPSQPTAILLPAPAAQTWYYFPRKSTPASCLPWVAPSLPPPHQTTSMPHPHHGRGCIPTPPHTHAADPACPQIMAAAHATILCEFANYRGLPPSPPTTPALTSPVPPRAR